MEGASKLSEAFLNINLKKKFIYLFIFRERGKEQEKHPFVASHVPPTGDLACNPSMCPDWELNWQPFSPQASAQSMEPH